MRDMSKDLTILVLGRGNTTMANLEENLDEWMFGDLETREIRFIVPILNTMGSGMKTFGTFATGMQGTEFTIVQASGAGMTKEITALPQDSFMRVADDREAIQKSLEILAGSHGCGDETAVIFLFDPKSTYQQGSDELSDQEIISDFKGQDWLTTLNLCEGLQDSFEGYESETARLHREKLEAEFAAKQAAEAPAKKATAPRKRAAKKPVDPEPIPAPAESQEPVYEPSGMDEFVRPQLPIEKLVERRAATELSAKAMIKAASFAHQESDVILDIQKDMADHHFSNTVQNRKTDLLIELGENVAAMGEAFSKTIRTMTELLKESNA